MSAPDWKARAEELATKLRELGTREATGMIRGWEDAYPVYADASEALNYLSDRVTKLRKWLKLSRQEAVEIFDRAEAAEAKCAEYEATVRELARQVAQAEARGMERAAGIAWSDDEDRPWESWGEDRNVRTAQTVAKEISAAILATISQEPQAVQDARVKPLVWHKSHMPNWSDDWHTIATGYTVRCADENGWKWSNGIGGVGYSPSPSAAKSDANDEWQARIRAALAGETS